MPLIQYLHQTMTSLFDAYPIDQTPNTKESFNSLTLRHTYSLRT